MEIIAEIGQNHNGEMSLALELIHAAKEHGADAAKFQLYNAKELFSKNNNPWFDYNCKTEISRSQMHILAEECKKTGIEFLASAFDLERVAWLEEAEVKRHKIASRSINDNNLTQALAATGKPLLVSLGMWAQEQLPQINSTAQIHFLYCISKYPTLLSDLHFSKIDFAKKYTGFSDHTVGILAAEVALARGAEIIEKHFTLDKGMYGPDHAGSMTPDELNILSTFRTQVEKCL